MEACEQPHICFLQSPQRCFFLFALSPRLRRWKGLPESVARSNLSALGREKHERERSLKKKKDQLAELLVQQISFRNLARRNRSQSSTRGAATAAAAAAAADPAWGGGGARTAEQDSEDQAASKVGFAVFCCVARCSVLPVKTKSQLVGLLSPPKYYGCTYLVVNQDQIG